MTSISTINKTEYTLLKCLNLSLRPSEKTDFMSSLTSEEWGQVLALADHHEVSPLLSKILESDKLPEGQLTVQFKTAKTVHTGIKSKAYGYVRQRGDSGNYFEGVCCVAVLFGSGISKDNGY